MTRQPERRSIIIIIARPVSGFVIVIVIVIAASLFVYDRNRAVSHVHWPLVAPSTIHYSRDGDVGRANIPAIGNQIIVRAVLGRC